MEQRTLATSAADVETSDRSLSVIVEVWMVDGRARTVVAERQSKAESFIVCKAYILAVPSEK
jgi:hypothetical protein